MTSGHVVSGHGTIHAPLMELRNSHLYTRFPWKCKSHYHRNVQVDKAYSASNSLVEPVHIMYEPTPNSRNGHLPVTSCANLQNLLLCMH
ncbi:hypothetical protein COCC4DRAFT_31396 [Bipolaris maydis ATCC 48331]|uniref:Uncharacterized protein n=2 Tax=Cochliobolus heterostrophus TaxID=5016 RepID=M2SQD1_COCH5|nr:uncharacterized protein COCC4DRAFT_31396 [Bipolaris maydis ATCC 48331]EMD87515.1 hypothetical protein COCHEDRAFT_1023591 [Bipolaris maydis C5]ENI06715.1 hypothetical protein COCC4DRAFT_31396 [Bipolaris maydis ATCC 48331]